MAVNRIDILLNADDRATDQIKRFERQTKQSSTNVKKDFTEMAIKAAALVVAIKAVANSAQAFISAASKVQQLRTRLTVLTGTVAKGNELFEDMADLASRVPFTYDQIMESAVNLRAVVKGGNEEVTRLMPIILDLAATTGLSIQETTSQMIRMYSAGAGAADLFRERGVLAMLGFQAGVSVSAEETMDRVIEAWEDGESRFRGATDKLAETWEGRVSMMQDAWFDFRSTAAEGFLDSEAPDLITNALKFWTEKIKESKNETEDMNDVLSHLNDRIAVVNELIEENMEKQSAPFLINRNKVEEDFNNLLIIRTRLLETFSRLQEEQAQEQIDLGRMVINSKEETIEEEILLEQDKLNIFESLHNSLTEKIISFRNKEFKNDEEKTKAKAKLQQQILNSSVANMEAWLAKEAEGNKAAAIAFKAVQTGRTVINTAEAISEASPNPILMAFAAAVGAAQLATIASVGFAKGTDSVPSMLTPGEMVVPRDFASAVRSGDLSISGPGGGQFGDINIFIQGGINSSGASVDDMAEELGFAVERELRTARGF